MRETKAIMTLKQKKIPNGVKLFLVSLPFLVLYFLFCYLPLEGWKYAFFDYKVGKQLSDCEFVGFKYFTYMFQNSITLREMIRVLRNTLVFALIGYATSFVPMLFAIFLNEISKQKLKKFVQTVTTIPNFISWVITFSLAFSILAPENGAMNIFLKRLGLIEKGLNVMAVSGVGAYVFMTLLGWWKGLGWGAIIYLAGINSIDQELYEAAEVDGAGRMHKIRYITIPGLMPTFITLLIMSIGSFLSTGVEQYLLFSNAFNVEFIVEMSTFFRHKVKWIL